MDKAKSEARQAISIIEAQLKFLDKAECLHIDEDVTRENLICTSEMDRTALARIAEEELMYLQKLPPKEKSMEVNKRAIFHSGSGTGYPPLALKAHAAAFSYFPTYSPAFNS